MKERHLLRGSPIRNHSPRLPFKMGAQEAINVNYIKILTKKVVKSPLELKIKLMSNGDKVGLVQTTMKDFIVLSKIGR